MKINFDQELKTLDDQPIISESKGVTLKSAAVNALLAIYPDEQNLSGEEKAKRYVLATRIYANSGDKPDLSLEDIVLIKKLIGKAYGPLIVGQSFQILEGNV